MREKVAPAGAHKSRAKDFLSRLHGEREKDDAAAKELAGEGKKLAIAGDLAGALKSFDGAVGLSPDLVSARRGRAAVRGRLGDYTGAVEDLERAVRLAPKCAPAWNDLGLTRQMLGDADGAMEAFQRAVGEDPSYFKAWRNLGCIYGCMGMPANALKAFNKAAEIRGDDFGSHYGKARASMDLGSFPQALEAANKALELCPGDVAALTLKAEVLAARKGKDKHDDYMKAIGILDFALEIDASYASAYVVKGCILQLMGWNDEANGLFAKAAELAGLPPRE